MIISVDSEKVLDKIQHPFMIKILNKVDMERMCFNMIKVIHIKLINITLCGEKLGESYPSKIRNKTRMPVLTTLIQNSIGSPSQNNQARKGHKRHPNQKGRSKNVTKNLWMT